MTQLKILPHGHHELVWQPYEEWILEVYRIGKTLNIPLPTDSPWRKRHEVGLEPEEAVLLERREAL
jgi:hypothetical protein